jgi:hypothetical protein
MQIAVIHCAFEETPRTVALVEVGNIDVIGINEALEYAYMRTQNLRGSWSRGEKYVWNGEVCENGDYSKDVTVMVDLPERNGEKMGLRSTSMGDQMLVGNTKYKVAMFGFEEMAA